ncbi:MAG: ribonuclease HII [Rhodospirillaceae bacterium]|nr:ribonuclease HII [Rhodospirillaceae bacterium]MBT5675164.1 ribonuclease HII [Rhodospirillaceae bacterium]MBT5781446.1 ribonuclease HII [Rhodospirillaceae bacterium]MBT6828610.1 ribonuclease HII [Rhodospirillaceae bacterium]MBT7291271.1 ribonuclease HII [Rhodospirillaceae bacterium]
MPDFSYENELGGRVAGIDEAGRGPWAGPVHAAAVIFAGGGPPLKMAARINDSKQLSASQREALYPELFDVAKIGIGTASVDEIDTLNILAASHLAMARALKALGNPPDAALVDGNRAPELPCIVRCVVKGDSKSLSIAAASIIAKVTRDRHMTELAAHHPGYAWERNFGYGTKQHREGLARLGVTAHHRRSFKPIRKLLEESSESRG